MSKINIGDLVRFKSGSARSIHSGYLYAWDVTNWVVRVDNKPEFDVPLIFLDIVTDIFNI